MAEKNLAKKAAVVVISRVLTTIIDLFIAIAIVRLLSKGDFAVISYLLMIYQAGRYIAQFGFPDSIFYFFEHISENSRRAFAYQTCSILLVTGLIAGAVIFGFKYFVAGALSAEWTLQQVSAVEQFLPYMAAIAILEIPTWPVNNILLALDRQKQAAWYQLLMSLFTFFSLVVPLALGYSLKVALTAMLVYAATRFVISIIWANMALPRNGEPLEQGTLRKQIAFSLPLGASLLVNRLNKYVDKFVVSALLPAAALADYNVGAQEIPVITVIPYALGSVLISRYVRFVKDENQTDLLALWHKGIQKVSLIVLPLMVMFITVAEDFVTLLFGENYIGAVVPFQIYSLILLQRVASYSSILQAHDDSKGVAKIAVLLLTANCILSVPFTKLWGIGGAAASTLTANAFVWIYILKRISKHLKISFFQVIPFKFYLSILMNSILSGVLTYFIRTGFLETFSRSLALIISVITFFVIFATFATLTGTLNKDDWKQLRNWTILKF